MRPTLLVDHDVERHDEDDEHGDTYNDDANGKRGEIWCMIQTVNPELEDVFVTKMI